MRILHIKSAIGLLCIFISVLFVFSTLSITQMVFLRNQSSDSYYLLALYEDLFVYGYDISQWNLTPAPYLFPDATLLFPLLSLFSDYGYGMAMYILLFWCTLLVCTAEIGAAFSVRRHTAYLIATVCMLLCMAVIRIYVRFGLPGFLFLPSFHGGCLFFGLISLWWMHGWLKQSPSKMNAMAYVVLSSLMIFSDPLYIAQFSLPIVITSLILLFVRQVYKVQAGFIIICNGISIAMAHLMYILNSHFDLLRIPRAYHLFQSPTESIWKVMIWVFTEQEHF